MTQKRIAVVGGGITGLAIAYRLAKKGHIPFIYEKSARLGGLITSFQVGPTRLEKFFHHIFHSDRALIKIIDELHLTQELFWKHSKMGFYGANKIFPFDGPFDLLRLSVLSWPNRIRFGVQTLRTQRRHDGIELDTITVKEWVQKEWSADIYDRFWRPLLVSKFGDAADNISAAWLWGRIYARAGSRKQGKEELGYFRGGFARLLNAMAQHIQHLGGIIKLHGDVNNVSPDSSGTWRVRDQSGSETYDSVVLAVPSPQISPLCPNLPVSEKRAHDSIRYQGILCLPVTMDRPLSPIYWLNMGDSHIPFTGVIEQTNFISPEAYGGQHLVYLFNYISPDHPWFQETKEVIFERYFEKGIRKIFPHAPRSQFKKVMIFRDRYATPIYGQGYIGKMPPMESTLANLYFANTSHIFPDDRNMNYSVELADRVVEKIVT